MTRKTIFTLASGLVLGAFALALSAVVSPTPAASADDAAKACACCSCCDDCRCDPCTCCDDECGCGAGCGC